MSLPSDIQTQRTDVLYGSENVLDTISRFLSKSKTIDSCGDEMAPSLVIEMQDYQRLLSSIPEKKIKVRYITNITKDNLNYCKELMKYFGDIRHLDGLKANFSVSESEYLASSATTPDLEPPKPIEQIIYSNVKDIVDQQKFVFESFWDRAILGEQRIKEIEEGKPLGKTEVIQIPSKTKDLFINLVNLAKDEILLLLPTTNAFLREHNMGIMSTLRVKSINENVNIQVLTPTNDSVNKILLDLGVDDKSNFTITPFEFKSDQINVSSVTILVVDKRESLVIEKIDDSKDNILDAMGLATYSTSKPTVLSYINIFEGLSKQLKLYDQLKTHGKMQEEFINIASHELRTPTQAILAYSELLEEHPEKREEMIQAIKRNALRLQRLTEDILDVTRIESKTLKLHKEKFDLKSLLSSIVNDYKDNIDKKKHEGSGSVRIYYDELNIEPCLVEADSQRIIQTISNLLDNAIKFTEEKQGGGDIHITTYEITKGNNQSVVIKIRDTGIGVDRDILPRLFTKFATNSSKGTGLGLFICKSIIEAHGGQIWAEDNTRYGNTGATFAFSLPFVK
ncbi:MAG TPA: HAMP domain-containing sensor histidine kinase [Phototrophicaceae bacterium]|nr:HAMP domain-containing sensor histidine kinase [Phototrophicaceae bacterium]